MSNAAERAPEGARRRLPVVFDIALTLVSGSFVFVLITGLLNAYAP